MTPRKTPAAHRISAAHSRLLHALQPTEEMPEAVIDILVRHRVDVQGGALAMLVGRLSGAAELGRPLSPTRVAEIVEDVLGEGERNAARYVEIAMTYSNGDAR